MVAKEATEGVDRTSPIAVEGVTTAAETWEATVVIRDMAQVVMAMDLEVIQVALVTIQEVTATVQEGAVVVITEIIIGAPARTRVAEEEVVVVIIHQIIKRM